MTNKKEFTAKLRFVVKESNSATYEWETKQQIIAASDQHQTKVDDCLWDFRMHTQKSAINQRVGIFNIITFHVKSTRKMINLLALHVDGATTTLLISRINVCALFFRILIFAMSLQSRSILHSSAIRRINYPIKSRLQLEKTIVKCHWIAQSKSS